MRAYLAFLLLPILVLLAVAASKIKADVPLRPALPAVPALAVPVPPNLVPPVTRRQPAIVNLNALMPVDVPRVIPMPALPPPPVAQVPMRLAAVFIDGDKRLAQIDDQLVEKGDRIAHYRVERIESVRVLLVGAGKAGERRWLEIAKGY